MVVEVKVLDNGVKLPFRGSEGASGYDVFTAESGVIKADRLVSKKFVFADEPFVRIKHDGSVHNIPIHESDKASIRQTIYVILEQHQDDPQTIVFDLDKLNSLVTTSIFESRIAQHKTSRTQFLGVSHLEGLEIEAHFGEFVNCHWMDEDRYAQVIEKYPVIISTNLYVEIPEGYGMEIVDRSGLGIKHSLSMHNGTIDSDYRGEIKIKAYNLGNKDYYFKKGERIAQAIIFENIPTEYKLVKELSDTKRGEGWGGSTGRV